MNARKLMINVVLFEISILGSVSFVMNVESMKGVQRMVGQPWLAWKNIFQDDKFWELKTEKDEGIENLSQNNVCCMKLPRSDMTLFGLCPKTELFELVICNYCGKKFKLSAFAEHVRVRHSDDNVTSPKSVSNLVRIDKSLLKKGKIKKAKEKIIKPKETDESPLKPQINHEIKIDFMELVSDKQSLVLESENVKKIKQINLKIKKNFKNIENENATEENKLCEKGNTCALKPETKNEINCIGSNNPNLFRPQSNVEGSTAPQEGEIINLQPVVQLTPLVSKDSVSELSPVTLLNPSDEKKVLELQSNSIKSEKSSSSDLQSETVDKDNAKVCNQATNNSAHSNSRRTVVCGKNKNTEAIVDISKDGEKVALIEVCNSCNSEKDSRPTISLTAGKFTKSHVLVNHKINKTEGVKVDQKLVKRITSDRPRLSLPVSIKNPSITNSILSQLQNKVIKSKLSSNIESNDKIQEVIKENFIHKQIRNTRLHRSKENSRAQKNIPKKDDVSETPDSKEVLNKVEGMSTWAPGFRRAGGGLLYANHNLPRLCITLKNVKNSTPLLRKEEKNCSINQPSLSNKIIDLVLENGQTKIENKAPLDMDSTAKRTSLHNKQKGSFLKSSNPTKISYQEHKVMNDQAQKNSKAVICKRLNSNTNGDVPAKVRKHDGIINIVSSVFTNTDHKIPVMHLEVPNNVFEGQILTPDHRLAPINTIDLNCSSSAPTGVEIISGNFIRSESLRVGAPRIHYFTSSGPIPASSNTKNIQQVQLKPIGIPHRYQFLAPQIRMAPTTGVYYLQRSTTNCSNINGIEEK